MATDLPLRTLLTAHSGCRETLPNSQDYLSVALSSQVAFVEVDLRLSAAGVLVLSHDPVDGEIGSILTLESIWSLLMGKWMGLNLDVKEIQVLPRLAAFLQAKPLEERLRVLVTGCDQAWVRDWRALDTAVPVLLNVLAREPLPASDEEWAAEVVNRAKHCGAAGLNVDHRLLTERLCRHANSEGLRVEVWTVNERADMDRYFRWGIDGLTTDRPDLAHEILIGF